MDTALIFFHVAGGAFALVAGGVAMLVRKGEAVHRFAGNVFFIAMLVMTTGGFAVAVLRDQPYNITASTLTFYLILTSWVAATRKDGEIGWFETVALIGGVAVAASAARFASLGGDLVEVHYLFGSFAAIGVLADLSVVMRGGVSGRQRIARHVWRMALALLIATTAYFVGQPKFVPEILRETRLNLVPVFAVLTLLLFWLVRVRFTRWWKDAEQTSN
ncbi:MAG: hypothetical protein KBA31_18345 [Alphaproteobacteria bacterium]|nr:hypothetical protein [Alphaproteobacteria bacterium]